jgi:hypothetical protein
MARCAAAYSSTGTCISPKLIAPFHSTRGARVAMRLAQQACPLDGAAAPTCNGARGCSGRGNKPRCGPSVYLDRFPEDLGQSGFASRTDLARGGGPGDPCCASGLNTCGPLCCNQR